MKKFSNEFKASVMRDNVVGMAVGVVIGDTFGKIVTSPMNDIIMPPIGFLLNGVNSKDLSIKLGEKLSEDGKTTEAVTVNYGNFIQQTVGFLITTFYIFLFARTVTKLTKKNEEEPEPAKSESTAEEKLLTEIRGLLKSR